VSHAVENDSLDEIGGLGNLSSERSREAQDRGGEPKRERSWK
jgi:hypothetical protein